MGDVHQARSYQNGKQTTVLRKRALESTPPPSMDSEKGQTAENNKHVPTDAQLPTVELQLPGEPMKTVNKDGQNQSKQDQKESLRPDLNATPPNLQMSEPLPPSTPGEKSTTTPKTGLGFQAGKQNSSMHVAGIEQPHGNFGKYFPRISPEPQIKSGKEPKGPELTTVELEKISTSRLKLGESQTSSLSPAPCSVKPTKSADNNTRMTTRSTAPLTSSTSTGLTTTPKTQLDECGKKAKPASKVALDHDPKEKQAPPPRGEKPLSA
jgi:hypothetical protein